MKFLIPIGGAFDQRFAGILTSYKHAGIPRGIKEGAPWAGDNCAFKDFEPDRYRAWLPTMLPYRRTCLFIVVPDAYADARLTHARWHAWRQELDGWPLAFVAQDGQEDLHLPADEWTTLFIGGSTSWKDGPHVPPLIAQAVSAGKHIHVGRVNWETRYKHFARLPGATWFTCDGTRTRNDGRTKALRAWALYQRNFKLYRSQLALEK